MDTKQAELVLKNLVKVLHDKGGVQVTPAEYETIAEAVRVKCEAKDKK